MDIFKDRTLDNILLEIKKIVGNIPLKDNQVVFSIFYDVLKLCDFRLKYKKLNVDPKQKDIHLDRVDIAELLTLVYTYYSREIEYVSNYELSQGFIWNFTESEALQFFKGCVVGNCKDKLGQTVHIDYENGMRFMYKESTIEGKHIVAPENYVPARGKKVPWIRHTIIETKNIFKRISQAYLEVIYINKYNILLKNNEKAEGYWIVVAKKRKKDTVGPLHFKTAFPIFEQTDLLRILERYSVMG